MGLFSKREAVARELPYATLGQVDPESFRREGEGSETIAMEAMRAFSTRALVGVPFGPGSGLGLDEAVKVARVIFSNEAPGRILFYGGGALRAVFGDIGRRTVSLSDWDDVLGHSEKAFGAFGLHGDEYPAALSALGNVKKLLTQFQLEQGVIYDKWQSDPEWALQVWVWTTIINARLEAAGRV